MKISVLMMAFVAFLYSMNVNAQEQEPKQKKKAKTEKECNVNGKKCCSSAKEEKDCTGKVSDEKGEGKKSCDKDSKGEKKSSCGSTKKD